MSRAIFVESCPSCVMGEELRSPQTSIANSTELIVNNKCKDYLWALHSSDRNQAITDSEKQSKVSKNKSI